MEYSLLLYGRDKRNDGIVKLSRNRLVFQRGNV